jgi:hypothetical protein
LEAVTALAARINRIDVLDEASALTLLADWSESTTRDLPDDAAAVARECGYLPLALAICGAIARVGASWLDIAEALCEADLKYVEARLPNYPYPDVLEAIAVGVDALNTESEVAVRCYQELLFYADQEIVPESTIVTLWKQSNQLSERESRKVLTKIGSKSLVLLEGKSPNRRAALHDLQRDYLRATVNVASSLHAELLDA